MKRVTTLLMAAAAFLAVLSAPAVVSALAPRAWAVDSSFDPDVVSSTQLIDQPEEYDGKRIVYRGEAIGDKLRRGELAWLAVNDDAYSRIPLRESGKLAGLNSGMGVYGPLDEIGKIELLGSYTTLGDFVEVRGVFYKSSAEHGGDTCIVADEVNVMRSGRKVTTSRMKPEFILASVLLIASVALASLIAARRKAGFGD